MEQYQQSTDAASPISGGKYNITVFGTPQGYGRGDREASCTLQIWPDVGCYAISMRPADARDLAAKLALAAIAAEAAEVEIIPFELREAA